MKWYKEITIYYFIEKMIKKYCEYCKEEKSTGGWAEHCKTKKHQENVKYKDEEKPKKSHICKKCDKSFNQASGLSRHKKQIHEGITSYGYYCTVCEVYLKDKTSAKKHRLSDTHFKVLRSPEFYEQFKAENRKIKVKKLDHKKIMKTVIKLNEKVDIKRTTEYKPKKKKRRRIDQGRSVF